MPVNEVSKSAFGGLDVAYALQCHLRRGRRRWPTVFVKRGLYRYWENKGNHALVEGEAESKVCFSVIFGVAQMHGQLGEDLNAQFHKSRVSRIASFRAWSSFARPMTGCIVVIFCHPDRVLGEIAGAVRVHPYTDVYHRANFLLVEDWVRAETVWLWTSPCSLLQDGAGRT